MKKTLFALSLFASAAAFAAVSTVDASIQITGVLPITASSRSVIVCVPWVASGVGDSDIAVSNIIKTANLTEGDLVKVYNQTKKAFNVWTLTAGTGGVLYWAGVQVATAGSVDAGDGADVTTLKRGDALILTRGSKWDETAYTFYVCGQYTSATAPSVTMAAGSSTTPAYTLVAPPSVSDETYDLNTFTWSNLPSTAETRGRTKGDYIVIGDSGASYYLNDLDTSVGTWGKRGVGTNWLAAPTVTTGVGFWYVSRGGSPTVAW